MNATATKPWYLINTGCKYKINDDFLKMLTENLFQSLFNNLGQSQLIRIKAFTLCSRIYTIQFRYDVIVQSSCQRIPSIP